jgi:hypothetical protein
LAGEGLHFKPSGALEIQLDVGGVLGEALVRGEVLGRQHDGLPGEPVTKGVEGGLLFTGVGFGAGGF